MPSVIVKLIYTPRPETDLEFVALGDDPEGLAVHFRNDRVWIEGDDLTMGIASFDPAEALSLANALVLVAGCADTRWRGWRWEAREQDGQLLATTPPGEWYGDKRDAVQAIRTLFGYGVHVALDYGDDSGMLLGLREPEDFSSRPTPDADPDECPVGKVEL